ncbi:MAG: phosphate ABC transporter substrate-binding/OmpA family protein [Candidatus Magnetoovum sp. WYHC-5]|nr:phosphate ABC transporter substrate-binding/OmpA family protein [Candidatus Magnetoovum sp. WYHC-5]
MSRQLKGALALFILGIIVIVIIKVLVPIFSAKKQIETSDAKATKGSIFIGVDNWIGYYPLCSKEMKTRMRSGGYKLECVYDSANYVERIKQLKKGALNLAAATVDSYVLNGVKEDYPAVIIMIIDESKGGDAFLARKDKLANLEELKTKDFKIAFTPNSPSEYMLKALGSHFDIPRLKTSGLWQVKTNGSSEALTKLISGKVDAAVLWEPDVSKALSEEGILKLMSTADTSKLIVDVLLVNRDYSKDQPDIVNLVLSSYFKTLKKYRDNPDLLLKEVTEVTKLEKSQVQIMLKGVNWVNLNDNAKLWFGISQPGKISYEWLIDTIDSTVATLIDNSDFSKTPLPDEDPYRIINSSFIEGLFVHGLVEQFHSNDTKTIDSSLEMGFVALNEEGWKNLQEVGTLKIDLINFMSGTSTLSIQGKEELDKAVNNLKHYPRFRVLIKGHTGLRGDKDANLRLSQERAEAVKQYLTVTYNINPNRLHAVGYGSNEPLTRKAGEPDRAYDYRLPRVELYLVSEVY